MVLVPRRSRIGSRALYGEGVFMENTSKYSELLSGLFSAVEFWISVLISWWINHEILYPWFVVAFHLHAPRNLGPFGLEAISCLYVLHILAYASLIERMIHSFVKLIELGFDSVMFFLNSPPIPRRPFL